MAYAPGIKAQLANMSEPSPILGGGKLPIGEYEITLTSINEDEQKLTLIFQDEMGDTHKELWWRYSRYRGYSSEWRNWLANTIPDLQAIEKYKDTGDLAPFIGTRIRATIGRSEGYHLLRNGDQWAPVVEGQLGELGDITSIKKEMLKAGIPRSYHVIEHYTVLNSSEIIKRWRGHEVYITEADAMEAPSSSDNDNSGDPT